MYSVNIHNQHLASFSQFLIFVENVRQQESSHSCFYDKQIVFTGNLTIFNVLFSSAQACGGYGPILTGHPTPSRPDGSP
jgi:hypothetical protein